MNVIEGDGCGVHSWASGYGRRADLHGNVARFSRCSAARKLRVDHVTAAADSEILRQASETGIGFVCRPPLPVWFLWALTAEG